jgi:hypothetical protein
LEVLDEHSPACAIDAKPSEPRITAIPRNFDMTISKIFEIEKNVGHNARYHITRAACMTRGFEP